MRIMRRDLVVPLHLTVVGIQGHNRASPQIGALASLTGMNRVRIARAPINRIQFRIICTRHPRHAAAMRHGILVRP